MDKGYLQQLRLFKGAVDHAKWQSFFIGQTVDGFAFHPFETGGIVVNTSADQSDMGVTVPLSSEDLALFDRAFNEGWLAQIWIYRFAPLTDNSPPSAKELVAEFIGEVIGTEFAYDRVTMKLGSALDPISAQIPPRKFTTALIGTPPR